jgi:hypothetical protein
MMNWKESRKKDSRYLIKISPLDLPVVTEKTLKNTREDTQCPAEI